jgi:acyl-CoA synthetase (AMP-forming)/AMP-acid ligase II
VPHPLFGALRSPKTGPAHSKLLCAALIAWQGVGVHRRCQLAWPCLAAFCTLGSCTYGRPHDCGYGICAQQSVCAVLFQVLEAAVVGVPHPKWGERPLLVVVPQSQYAPGEPVKAVRASGLKQQQVCSQTAAACTRHAALHSLSSYLV